MLNQSKIVTLAFMVFSVIYGITMTYYAIPEFERRIADWGYNHKLTAMQAVAGQKEFIEFAAMPTPAKTKVK